MSLAERLVLLRERKGLTQAELAKKLNISRSALSLWEISKREPDYKTLEKIASLFSVSIDYLLGFSNNPNRSNIIKEPETTYNLSNDAIPVGETRKVPVIGTIRCGDPIYAFEDIQEWIDVPISDLNGGEHFFLTVTGDSMTGSNIYPGYRVLVRRQDTVDNGQIVVAITKDCEATLKRVKFLEEAVILYPDNPKYQPQIYKLDEVRIIGRIVKVEFKP